MLCIEASTQQKAPTLNPWECRRVSLSTMLKTQARKHFIKGITSYPTALWGGLPAHLLASACSLAGRNATCCSGHADTSLPRPSSKRKCSIYPWYRALKKAYPTSHGYMLRCLSVLLELMVNGLTIPMQITTEQEHMAHITILGFEFHRLLFLVIRLQRDAVNGKPIKPHPDIYNISSAAVFSWRWIKIDHSLEVVL